MEVCFIFQVGSDYDFHTFFSSTGKLKSIHIIRTISVLQKVVPASPVPWQSYKYKYSDNNIY